jgi:hypothetical protein
MKLDPKVEEWIVARKRHHLSHTHVQMARELGMNPRNLGSIDNHRQEPWKAPLPEFIEHLYQKRFGRTRPEVVVSIEERARQHAAKKAQKKAAKAERRAAGGASGSTHLACSPGTASAAEAGEVRAPGTESQAVSPPFEERTDLRGVVPCARSPRCN